MVSVAAMTAPIPEEQDQPPLDTTTRPPGEHASELPDRDDAAAGGAGQEETQQESRENAETSLDEPSDDAGGQ